MSTKSERRAAREVVAAYHEAQLAELLQRVGQTVDSFRAGELDAFDADQVIFQYSRAAKELWKFCNLGDVVFTARLIGEEAPAAGIQLTLTRIVAGDEGRSGMNTTELIARGDFAHASLRMATAAYLARFKVGPAEFCEQHYRRTPHEYRNGPMERDHEYVGRYQPPSA